MAVRVELADGDSRFFLTWGRIQDPVDPAPLERIVLGHCRTHDLGGEAVSAQVCWSLQDARNSTYFCEALIHLAAESPGPGTRSAWRARVAAEMDEGRHLYFLGRPRPGAG